MTERMCFFHTSPSQCQESFCNGQLMVTTTQILLTFIADVLKLYYLKKIIVTELCGVLFSLILLCGVQGNNANLHWRSTSFHTLYSSMCKNIHIVEQLTVN